MRPCIAQVPEEVSRSAGHVPNWESPHGQANGAPMRCMDAPARLSKFATPSAARRPRLTGLRRGPSLPGSAAGGLLRHALAEQGADHATEDGAGRMVVATVDRAAEQRTGGGADDQAGRAVTLAAVVAAVVAAPGLGATVVRLRVVVAAVIARVVAVAVAMDADGLRPDQCCGTASAGAGPARGRQRHEPDRRGLRPQGRPLDALDV